MARSNLPDPSPFVDWRSQRYANKAEARELSEGYSRDLIWSQATLFSESRERGRKLFSGNLNERNSKWREFSSFIKQARDYDDAASLTTGPSRTLLIYYTLMNLAKAELLRSAPDRVQDTRITHGLSPNFSKNTRFEGDTLTVREGVFGLLYQARTGITFPQNKKLNIRRLLRQIPELATNVETVFGDKSAIVPFCLAAVSNNSNEYWHIAMTPWLAGLSQLGDATSKVFNSHMKAVSTPTNPSWREIFAISPSFNSTEGVRCFESRQKYSTPEIARLALHFSLKPILEPCLGSEFDFQIAPSLLKGSQLFMPSDLSRYAAMHYASSLVRYRPSRVNANFHGDTSWILTSLAHEGYDPALHSAICGALNIDVFFKARVRV